MNDNCNCSVKKYWSSINKTCKNMPSFNQSCQESIICDYTKYLNCDSNNNTCSCNATSYWAAELNTCGIYNINLLEFFLKFI